MTLDDRIKEINKQDKEFFEEAFTNPVTRLPYAVPDDLKKAAEHITRAYGIRGICDPMYIANVIAMYIGRGDGQSHFNA